MYAAYLNILCSLLAQTASNEAEQRLVVFPYYARQAAAYDFFLDENRTERLKVNEQPVLTWTNAADRYMGGVFVWTYGGRPEVIGCIGSRQTAAGDCVVFQELHSLSPDVIQPTRFADGKRVWKPTQGGIELHDMEDEKE